MKGGTETEERGEQKTKRETEEEGRKRGTKEEMEYNMIITEGKREAEGE